MVVHFHSPFTQRYTSTTCYLRNQYQICNGRSCTTVSSRHHLCARIHAGNDHTFRIRLHFRLFRHFQQRGEHCVRCSSTADAPRDNCVPIPTLYELLGIPQHVGLPEIKVAYRQMARRYHPDVCPPTEREECTKRFLQVQEAYDTLSDPHLRADYDLWLQNPLNTRTLSAEVRAGNRRRTGKSDIPGSRFQWRDQWESQIRGLRQRAATGGKRESWASRMRREREEAE